MKSLKRFGQIGIIVFIPLFVLLGNMVTINKTTPTSAYAANIVNDTGHIQPLSMIPSHQTISCESPKAKTRCKNGTVCSASSIDTEGVCSLFGGPLEAIEPAEADETLLTQAESAAAESLGFENLIFNGNFEFGFYQVPELGFEAPDVGNVPINWDWYRNPAYGKYNIYNNERFGIICPDDLGAIVAAQQTQALEEEEEEITIFGTEHTLSAFGGDSVSQPVEDDSPFGPIPGYTAPPPNNSLSLHMQSTDQNDARLGVYQTVNVVPGQHYRFSMSGTILAQSGSTTLQPSDPNAPREARNNMFELSFDHSGGTNWEAIPHEERIIVDDFGEQKLEFKVSEDDEDIAEIRNYETFVTAQSDKMTIFITAWRKWANWRTTIYNLDCIALTPVDAANLPNSVAPTPVAGAQTAALAEPGETQAEVSEQPQTESDSSQSQTVTGLNQAQLPTTGVPIDESTLTQSQPDAVPEQQLSGQQPGETTATQSQEETPSTQAESIPTETQSETSASLESDSAVPTSGGVLESTSNVLLFAIASLLIILGLVGAGIWNMRRR